MNKNIDLSNDKSIPSFLSYLPKSQDSSLFLSKTYGNEIIGIINELKSGKSSDIPINVIKHIKNIIAPHLSKLFNSCMAQSTFPSSLKTGWITPMHKKGPRNDITNYRPVSTLPIFGKIFEKIIFDRLYSFITASKILSTTQFGFRKRYSTSHAVNHSIDLIKNFQIKGKDTIGIFIDLSEAFNTLDHATLLAKLERYGIRGISHDLIKSYLTNRYQIVSINGTLSKKEPAKYGVPHGSVLGPLLFFLYINDLQNSFVNSRMKFFLYADDTNIFISCNTAEEAMILANKVLSNVRSYMMCNMLHINLDKSCFMHFPCNETNVRKDTNTMTESSNDNSSYVNDNNTRTLPIGDERIPEVDSIKFLGVTFDRGLTWGKHTENLCKHIKCALAVIKHIKHCVTEQNFKTLYSSLFESHLRYGISVWGIIFHRKLDKLFRLQKNEFAYCSEI